MYWAEQMAHCRIILHRFLIICLTISVLHPERSHHISVPVSYTHLDVYKRQEHALQSGSNSQAAAYIHLLDSDDGSVTYGVGVSSNITRASVRAIFSAMRCV